MSETILQKIRHLLNKTVENGCTESEAQAAADKVGELLLQYNLSMQDLSDFTDEQKAEQELTHYPVYLSTYWVIETIAFEKRLISLLGNLGKATGCKILIMNVKTPDVIVVIGPSLNVDTCIELFDKLYHALLQITGTETQAATRRKRQNTGNSRTRISKKWTEYYFYGILDRVSERVKEHYETTLTKLNAHEYAIAMQDKNKEYMKLHWPNTGTHSTIVTPIDSKVYQAGISAGNNVALGLSAELLNAPKALIGRKE